MPWGYRGLQKSISKWLYVEKAKHLQAWKVSILGPQYAHMKVVISKSGLAVSVPKNANISGTIQAMKILKLALCRGRLELSCHIKI